MQGGNRGHVPVIARRRGAVSRWSERVGNPCFAFLAAVCIFGGMSDRMTGAKFIKLRLSIGWSRVQLAERLDCDEAIIRAMEAGRRPVPGVVAEWVTRMAALVAENPPPQAAVWKKLPRRDAA